MERQSYRLSLKKYGNGAGVWVAQFNRDAMTSADGFGSGPTPWRAVQQPAWVVMSRLDRVRQRPAAFSIRDR
jgi:hypothetical protein